VSGLDAGCAALLIPAAAFTADVVTQVLSLRCAPRLGIYRSHLAGFGAGAAALLALLALPPLPERLAPWDRAGTAAAAALTYGCLGYCYFHFINLGATARRIRLMAELVEAPEGLTREGIRARYSAREIVARRIDRLVATGQIVRDGERYRPGGRALLLSARLMVALKIITQGKRSEFD
jgi:hypothetical protein